MKYLYITVFLFGTLYSQGSPSLDSLENALKTAKGIDRIDLLNDIGFKLVFNDQTRALDYSTNAIASSRALAYQYGEIRALYIKGIVYDIRGLADSSKINFTKGYELSKIYDIPKLEADGLNNLGMMNWNLANFEEALEYFLLALRHYEQLDLQTGIAKSVSNIGLIYQELFQYEKALAFNRRSLKLRLAEKDDDPIARSYNNIGICFESLAQFDSALYYFNLGLKYARRGDAIQVEASISDNMANVYNQLDQNQLAIDYHKKSLKLTGDRELFGQVASHNNLGALYNEIGNYKQALYHVNTAQKLNQKTNAEAHALDTYRNKAEALLFLNQKDSALKYFKLWGAVKDSTFGQESQKAVAEMQTKYETEKKEQAINLLTVQSEIQQLQLTNTKYVIIGTAIVGILVVGLVVGLYSRRNYKLKSRLAIEREKLQKKQFKSLIEGEEKERKRIAQELHDGLGQLLSTARLNVSAMEDKFEKLVTKQWENSIKLIDEAVTEVRHISHNMMPNALISIGFEAALKEQTHIINDAGKVKVHVVLPKDKIGLPESEAIALYRVIQEILNNALKYSEAKNIWLKITNEEALLVSIEDDGKGFDIDLMSDTSGIGWANIKSRMEILNGQVQIASAPGKGSEISLKLAN